MGIRDKLKDAVAGGAAVDTETPPETVSEAVTDEAPEPDVDVVEDTESETAVEADEESNVVDIRDAMVDNLTDEDVEKFLAQQASGPLVAGLAATRETKLSQVQYDGKTTDGYVVRVWAPKGAPMLVKVRLEPVA